MSELYFVPTPNWFTSRPIDIFFNTNDYVDTNNGLVALSVMSSIYFTDKKFEAFYGCIKDAHLKRINSLVFYKKSTNIDDKKCVLASCGDDLEVKIWNTQTRVLINSHKLHQNIPSCLDWFHNDNELVLISGDVKGNIFKWNGITNEHVRYFPENKPITQIKTCKNQYITAVGYSHGNIVILNAQNEQMKILYKLKSHSDSINCLCWYPANVCDDNQNYIFNDLTDNSVILCSSSEDKKIRLWSIENGTQILAIDAPGHISDGNSGRTDNKINYTPILWPTQRHILSSSYSGDLFLLDLNDRNGSLKWKQFKTNKPSRKVIYDINYYDNTIITLSLDKSISSWNLESLKQESCISTLNGYIYSIISSPIDPNTYAIAAGDYSIKIFNEKQNERYCKTFSNNIKAEVTQLAWHPTKESILAFGTKDGRIGIIDSNTVTKPAQYIFTEYNQSVYTLLWSFNLLNPKSDQYYYLYSVADGKILQHSIKYASNKTITSHTLNLYNEIKNINKDTSIDQCGLTELAVLHLSQTENYFTIGKFDGSIELYKTLNGDIKRLCTFLNHNKLVTILKWNKNGRFLASGSNDFNIIIIDFFSILSDFNNNENFNLKYISKYKHKLTGHKERITGINWSVFDENLFVSCSYDGTAQIWNALDGTAIANYRGHSDKLLCCLFSNNEQNFVYSGGEDYALHYWNIDKQSFKTPPEECQLLVGKKKKQYYKKVNQKQKTENTQSDDEVVSVEVVKPIEIVVKNQEVVEDKSVKRPKQQSFNITTLMKESRSIFTYSARAHRVDNLKPLQECLRVFETLYENKNIQVPKTYEDLTKHIENIDFNFDPDFINLNIICNRKSLFKLIQHEVELNDEKLWLFDIWKGNIEALMDNLSKKGMLNDFFMNIFQLATQNVSTKYVNIYCEQLIQQGDYHKAALYYIASYNLIEAIEVYLKFNQYQFALCLAQIRFNKNDEIFKRVLKSYADYTKSNGDFETSVMLYIRLCDFSNALNVLNRRTIVNDEQKCLIDELILKFSKIDSNILC